MDNAVLRGFVLAGGKFSIPTGVFVSCFLPSWLFLILLLSSCRSLFGMRGFLSCSTFNEGMFVYVCIAVAQSLGKLWRKVGWDV